MPKLEQGSHRLAVDGLEVAYDVRGSGKTVCIAHPGGPGLDSQYLHLDALEKRFTMVYINPLGTGASSKLPAGQVYSMARDVGVVEAMRKKLGIEKACLIGHSYGGMVMLRYASEQPDHVGSLFLYSTSPTTNEEFEKDVEASAAAFFKDQPFFAAAMKASADEAKATDDASLGALIELQFPLYFADYLGHKALYDPLLRSMRITFDVYRRRPVGTKANAYDVRGKLGRLHLTPTVIVAGEKDFVCGVKPSTWIAQSIAGSKLIVIPQAGHFAHLEQAAAFDDAVEQFAKLLR
jgi:proline iminopeptidase